MQRSQATVVRWDSVDPQPIRTLLDDMVKAHAKGATDLRAMEHKFDDRWAAMCAKPENWIFVSWFEGKPVGLAVVTEQPMDPWSERPSGIISMLHVSSHHRKSGVANGLLRSIVQLSEQEGWSDLLVHVSPGLRDSQRYFARLGFSPAVTRRVAPVDGLRRKLGMDTSRARITMPRITRRAIIARTWA